MNATLQDKLVAKEQAIEALLAGQVGVIPTDTVYGLVARAHDEQAVARLYALKSREHKPGTIIAASTRQLQDLGIPDAYLVQTANLWPNPLSIVLPIGVQFGYLHQGLGNIPVRVVDDSNVRTILEKTGPLVTSSANQPGEPGSVTVDQAWDYFNDAVDFYLDDGDRSGRAPSTIIRLLDDGEIEVVRPGAVKL